MYNTWYYLSVHIHFVQLFWLANYFSYPVKVESPWHSLSQAEQIWLSNRVFEWFSTCTSDFWSKSFDSFSHSACTHQCVGQNIWPHQWYMLIVPLLRTLCWNTTVQFNVLAEMICLTIPINVLIDHVNTDVQFIVLVETICHTITLHVSINSTHALSNCHIKPRSKIRKF